jgi:hypothetical protein
MLNQSNLVYAASTPNLLLQIDRVMQYLIIGSIAAVVVAAFHFKELLDCSPYS